MSKARENILARLRQNRANTRGESPPLQASDMARLRDRETDDPEQLIQRFIERQSAVHGEVHRVPKAQWINWLAVELPKRGLRRVLTGTGAIGEQLGSTAIRGTRLSRYDRDIETWKPELFAEVDVAITGTRCGIAETGSLVLWPDENEPRLMSLVPPVHIALLDAAKLHPTLSRAMQAENWALRMPTNALLISGPSKTADIEQTLAYGIHGPKQLITLLLE